MSAGSAASVTTKASMVAMSGATMPEPLAIPAMVTTTPSISALATAPLAKVSVVMIACGRGLDAVGAEARDQVAHTGGDLLTGSRCPMTPVEATKTSSALQCNRRRHRLGLGAHRRSPSPPRKTLALPALTISARA